MEIRKVKIQPVLAITLIIVFLAGLTASAPAETENFVKFEKAKESFKRGFYFFNEMKYLAAVEHFRKAVSEYPEYNTAREYLARSYKLAGFTEEALKEWEILADAMANSVSIVNKINTIKYRDSQDVAPKEGVELLFFNEYSPVDMGRYRFPDPIDIALDREKNLYITSFSTGKLVKLDLNGKGVSIFSRGIDSRFYGVDCLDNMLCLSDFKEDKIFILDTEFNIVKSFGSPGNHDGEFHGPEGLSYDEKGNIYVVDSGNHRVQKFDKDGNFILKFGKPGEYEGQLKNPSHVTVYRELVYITDTGNKRVACFDDSGNFIENISIEGFSKPRGIDIYNKYLVIADEIGGLLLYGLNNGSKLWFNSWGKESNNFARLISADTDRDNILYCLDYQRESVLIFTPIESRYNNLDVEITAVDLDRYPVVAFYLNIRSRSGKPVYGLKRKNFRVVEDNAGITGFSVDYYKDIDKSASFVLCVDRSYTAQGYHNEIPWVSDFILKKMRKNDSIKVLNFNKDFWTGNDFDWSRRRTIAALKKKEYGKEKYIGKALYNAVSDLLPRVNKRGVVFISDGSVDSDSFKQFTPQNIIEYARSHFIPIYFIVFKEKSHVLQKIAEETGGGIYKASELDSLRKIYDRVKFSEEYRYLLVYSTYKMSSVKGWWSDVKIEVDHKGQKGVEWGGYFVP